MVIVAGRDLERGHDPSKPLDGRHVERRRHEHHARGTSGGCQRLELGARELKAAERRKPCRLVGGHKVFRHNRLKLDRLRAGLRRAPDHLFSEREAAFVVVADLGDNQHLAVEVNRTDFHVDPP